MTPTVLPFSDLHPGVHALTDASSLAALAGNSETLSAALNPVLARSILADVEGYGLEASLSLLERWIVVEDLVVDVIALATVNRRSDSTFKSYRYEPSELELLDLAAATETGRSRAREHALLEHITRILLSATAVSSNQELARLHAAANELSLSFTFIPADIFRRCASILARTANALEATRPDVSWRSFGFGLEKAYGELLGDFYDEAWFLARSHFGVERTLVYYETAAAAGVPVVLHPNRHDETSAIDAACCDAYASVKNTLRTTLEEPVRSQLESLGQTYSITIPPLVSKLVEIAGRQQVSIIQAAQEVKASKNAVAFRKWLADIQINLAHGTTAGQIEGLRMLNELKQVATSWAVHLDPTVGVTHKKRELRLSWVPRIGGLLDLLEKPTLRDPILNRKGYMGFISSWFRQGS